MSKLFSQGFNSLFSCYSLKVITLITGVVIVALLAMPSCKKPVIKPNPPQPEVGTVWVGAYEAGYIDFALKYNVKLAAIFETNGTQTPEITNWINFIKSAQQRGAKLRICPIPVSDSAYLDDRHAAAQLAIVWNFVQLMQSQGVKPGELILDIEGMNASKYCQALVSFVLGNTAARDTLIANVLPKAAHDSAIAAYQAFVNQAHNAGWRVGATTLNQIACEPVGGDINIERVLGIPITGISWDFVTYQAYRTSTYSVFQSIGFPSPTSWFVYRFAQMARGHYGANGGVDIGIMGINSSWGYSSIADWQNDVSATRAAGINPDLVAGFRMESAITPNFTDSTQWFTQLETSPAPTAPIDDLSTDDYILLYDSADSRLAPFMPQ